MKTRRQLLFAFSLLAAFSLLLSACAQPTVEELLAEVELEATEAAVAPAAEVTEEPVEEATAAPTEEPTPAPVEVPSAEELLDENLSAFLAGMEGFNSVTPEAVYTAIVDGDAPFLIDVRTAGELEENGHIEGAVHIPLQELAQNVDKLPSAGTPIVVYCAAGTRAAIGMMALAELGYTDVASMQGGSFGGWADAEYPIAEGLPEEAPALNEYAPDPAVVQAVDAMLQGLPQGFAQVTAEDLNSELVEGADLVLVDVRTPAEVAENGQIEGAVNIPLDQMIEMRDEWPAQDADIVIYCAKGYRGNMGMSILRAYGYENVRNLGGGFGAWAEAGLPVVESDVEVEGGLATPLGSNTQAFLDNMQGYNAITLADLNSAIVEGNPPFLVDVRTAEEVEQEGHIEGAVLIPLPELAQNVDKLPSTDTPIVVYCAAGTRATIGMMALGQLGYTDVKSLQDGSFGGWVDAGFTVVPGLPEEAPVLDEADVNPAALAAVDAMLQNLPAGYGQLTVEDLNAELLDGAELVLVDVRTAGELAETGKIEGAVNIPLERMIEMQDEWPAQDADIVIYCRRGYRGNMAMTVLRTYGYENIRNLQGGFTAWVDAGLPVAAD